MKKTSTIILALFTFLLTSQAVIAQDTYKINRSDETYGHLGSAAINLNIDEQNLSDEINAPTSMYFFGGVYRLDNLRVNLETGSLSILGSTGNTLNIYGFKVKEGKLRYVDGKTFVYYRGDSEGWLKVQFEDVGIEGRGDDELLNFQIWINHKTNNIKFHYGKNTTENPLIKMTVGLVEEGPEPNNEMLNSYRLLGLAARFSGVSENTEEVLFDAPHDGFAFTLEPSSMVSVAKTNLAANINIYPNPASSSINITVNDNTTVASTRVLNVMGQEVITTLTSNSINVADLKAGIYFIEVNDNEGNIARKKFIKQ